jgi:hypothetical protein
LLPAGAVAGWDLHPLENAALSRRTPAADIGSRWPNAKRFWNNLAATTLLLSKRERRYIHLI